MLVLIYSLVLQLLQCLFCVGTMENISNTASILPSNDGESTCMYKCWFPACHNCIYFQLWTVREDMQAVYNSINLKKSKKPKKHKKLSPMDMALLRFVAKMCTQNSDVLAFPSNGKAWEAFCNTHAAKAMEEESIIFPSLPAWNVIRTTRLYDVLNDMLEAQQWWKVARGQHNLLGHAGAKPPSNSCASACRKMLVCPVKQVPLVIQFLRCDEIVNGLKSGKPADYHKGAHICKTCKKFSVPICYVKNSSKCLDAACREKRQLLAQRRKSEKEMMEKLSDYVQTRIITRPCSQCQCSIKCRIGELKPRKNIHTQLLMVYLCRLMHWQSHYVTHLHSLRWKCATDTDSLIQRNSG